MRIFNERNQETKKSKQKKDLLILKELKLTKKMKKNNLFIIHFVENFQLSLLHEVQNLDPDGGDVNHVYECE